MPINDLSPSMGSTQTVIPVVEAEATVRAVLRRVELGECTAAEAWELLEMLALDDVARGMAGKRPRVPPPSPPVLESPTARVGPPETVLLCKNELHPRTPENRVSHGDGYGRCKPCRRESDARRRRANRGAA